MTKNKPNNINFDTLEKTLLRQEIEILKQEMLLQREEVLKDVATRLTGRNMAFPVIREIVDLPEEELRAIFYGSLGKNFSSQG